MKIEIKKIDERFEVWIDNELLFKSGERRAALSVARMAAGCIRAKAPGWRF